MRETDEVLARWSLALQLARRDFTPLERSRHADIDAYDAYRAAQSNLFNHSWSSDYELAGLEVLMRYYRFIAAEFDDAETVFNDLDDSEKSHSENPPNQRYRLFTALKQAIEKLLLAEADQAIARLAATAPLTN